MNKLSEQRIEQAKRNFMRFMSPNLLAACVTGSVAKGYADETSDIDTLLFFKEKLSQEEFDKAVADAKLSGGDLHLVQYMPEGESISDFMRDFKRHTSSNIKKELERSLKEGLLGKLISTSGTGKFKLWMDRFDCQIIVTENVLTTKIN